LISISRNVAPFGKLNLKVITRKCLLLSSAPVNLGATARSKIFDPTSQFFLLARINSIRATWPANLRSRKFYDVSKGSMARRLKGLADKIRWRIKVLLN
jgi:hypothetical protein